MVLLHARHLSYGDPMTLHFGAVASLYDDVRPGYPPALLPAIVDYHGAVPATVAEPGAGTGKGTELLVRLAVPITAIEPDPRMAEVLRAKFPQVQVVGVRFEEWTPPAGGVDLIGCGLAWHWLDPATRNRRALDALAPGGTLAVFAHKYNFADPAAGRRVLDVIRASDPTETERPDHWILDDVAGSGLFTNVRERVLHRPVEFSTERYLQLTQTFGPFRRRSPAGREQHLRALRETIDDLGGSVVLDIRTNLVLARRPG
jgi:SAM-dependent methyltransferase